MTDEIKNTTIEQWQVVDKLVGELMHEPYIIPTLPHMSVESGIHKVKYAKATDVKIANTGNKFDYDIMNVPSRIWNEKPIVRKTIPILLDHQDNDLSSKVGVQSLLVQEELEANKQMFDYITDIIFHGAVEVPGSEGMCNFTGLTKAAASAAWTTAKNFAIDLEIGLSALREKKILPPYTIIMTPGIPAELRGNWIDNIGNEWMKSFVEIYLKSFDQLESGVLINAAFVTDAICTGASGKKETLSTDNQCFLLYKSDPTVCYVAESETIGRKNIPSKKFEEDIVYAKIWGGCFIPKFPDGIYLCYSGDTTTAY